MFTLLPGAHRHRMSALAALMSACLTAAVLLTGAATAHAAFVTSQARAAHAGFLLSMPAPASAGAVCVIDSGNTPNVDAGQVRRLDMSGGDGADQLPSGHGTLVAQIINAPADSNGITGMFPAANVVSVKADVTSVPGKFNDDVVAEAIGTCTIQPGVQVINLSIASYKPASPALKAAVAQAQRDGVSVVAAAGNYAGMPVASPANLPGVISVGGVAQDGQRSAFTTEAPTTLVALGDDVMITPLGVDRFGYSTGTSYAAPQVSAALVALRAYKPGLDARAAEQTLISRARSVAGGAQLDVLAAFRAAGVRITRIVPRPERPFLFVERRGGRVKITGVNRPAGVRMVALRGRRVVARAGRTLRLPVTKFRAVRVAYERAGKRSMVRVVRHVPRTFANVPALGRR